MPLGCADRLRCLRREPACGADVCDSRAACIRARGARASLRRASTLSRIPRAIQNTSPSLCSVSSHRKGRRGKARFERLAAAADLAQQRAVLASDAAALRRRMRRTRSSPSSPAASARRGSCRYSGGSLRHAARIDIGRVAEDQVVALAARAARRDRRDGARCDRPADGVATLRRASASAPADRSTASMRARGKTQRRQDGEAARAGAEVEHAPHLARIADRQDAVGQHVADEGARDQRPPVGVEAHAVHVGRAHQIGRGQAQADAGIDQGEQPRALGRGRPRSR